MGCNRVLSTASRSTRCWRAARWPHLQLWSPLVRALWAWPCFRGRDGAPGQPLMLRSPTGPELPVGPVTDLQATELPGQRVRVSWSPVPGATEYRIAVRSTQGEGDTATPTHTLKIQFLGSDGTFTPSFHSWVSTASFCLLVHLSSRGQLSPDLSWRLSAPSPASAHLLTGVCLHSLPHVPSPQAQAQSLPFSDPGWNHCPH